MAIKKVLLSKKINDALVHIYPKTSSDVVVFNDSTSQIGKTTAQEAIDYLVGLVRAIDPDGTDVNELIKAATDELYETIMGVTDKEQLESDYQNFKQIVEWIDEHGAEAAEMVTSIDDLESAVFVYNDEDQTYDKTQYNFSKVEASETNGNILVDGEEVVVYTPSEIQASEIVTDEEHEFVTDEEKELWNTAATTADAAAEAAEAAQAAADAAQEAADAASEAAQDCAKIEYVEEEPDEPDDNTLYLVYISDEEEDGDDTGDTGGNQGGRP